MESPEAHALGFGAEERVEELRHCVVGNTAAGVGDHDFDAVLRSHGAHANLSAFHRALRHGIHRVHDQVRHLLEVDPIALDGMGAVEVGDQVDAASLGVGAHERQHLGGNLVEVARQEFGLVLSEEPPHSVHDLARPQIVLANGLEDLAQLVEARVSGIEQHLGGVGIAQDGSERLVDLVGDQSR